jgi:FkbM family methyltransferase
MSGLIFKIKKLTRIIASVFFIKALQKGVTAGVEHKPILQLMKGCKSVVDIGANRGQFALVAKYCFPEASIISFEPLPEPAVIFQKVFSEYNDVTMHNVAISTTSGQSMMHVSERDDSSSLLPISNLQEEIFPGTREIDKIVVKTASLNELVPEKAILSPALLKLDVQGFELDCLKGCESLLKNFKWVYCECSFVELYSGQRLAPDVIKWLADRGFSIIGIYNTTYDKDGRSIQADFLFVQQF